MSKIDVIRAALKTMEAYLPQAQQRMLDVAGKELPIRGLPTDPMILQSQPFIPGPSRELRELAQSYMDQAGLPYTPVQNYVQVDIPRAQKIAKEFEAMRHSPNDPATRRSYEAMAKETRDQYEQLLKTGVKFEPVPSNIPDPYAATPRLAAKDALENKHMWYFPTEQGFGSEAIKDNKLLEKSGVKIGGIEVPYNDLFRIVHDMFGHHKEGLGFRAAGEENAWRSHARMYSPEALPAMTAETRGQNSWVNYGPFGQQNRTASAADTVYAPQKTGMIPDWVVQAGRMSPLGIGGLPIALDAYQPQGQR